MSEDNIASGSSVPASDSREDDIQKSSDQIFPKSLTEVKLNIDILLKPAGDAPIMKKKKWSVERTKKIGSISEFIKKYIKMAPSESVFLYVSQSFAPSPDTEIGTVFDCFGSDGKVVLHYCRTQAWG